MGQYEDLYGGGWVGMPANSPNPQQALSNDIRSGAKATGMIDPMLLAQLQGIQSAEAARSSTPSKEQMAQVKVPKEDPDIPALRRSIAQEENRKRLAQLGTLDLVAQKFGVGLPEGGTEVISDPGMAKAISKKVSDIRQQLLLQGMSTTQAEIQAIAMARAAFPNVDPASLNQAIVLGYKGGRNFIPKLGAFKTGTGHLIDVGASIGAYRAAAMSSKARMKVLSDPTLQEALDAIGKHIQELESSQAIPTRDTFLESAYNHALTKTNGDSAAARKLLASQAMSLSVALALKGLL